MKKFGSYISYLFIAPVIWLLSVLPFGILYRISDLLYIILYHVIGYRREVVQKNLEIAFPEKSPQERKKLEKKFYKHLADLFLEMIKTFTISRRALAKRFDFHGAEILNKYYDEGKSVIVYGGHQGNWEWLISTGSLLKHRPMAVYKKLSNPFVNDFMLKSRTKFGFDFVPTYDTYRYIARMEKSGEKVAYGFLGDQNPLPHKAQLWLKFFGKEIPVHTGAEEVAKKYDIPVVFLEIKKVKRGRYATRIVPITDRPRELPDFEITRRYFELLEESIKKHPEDYYWIHRRFKHAKN